MRSRTHVRGEQHGVGGEGLPENLNDEVEVAQILTHLRHEGLDQVIVHLLLGRRRLLVQRKHADVLLHLMEHVHQHLQAETQGRSQSWAESETELGGVWDRAGWSQRQSWAESGTELGGVRDRARRSPRWAEPGTSVGGAYDRGGRS